MSSALFVNATNPAACGSPADAPAEALPDATPPAAPPPPVTWIGPARGWQPVNVRELWQFRGLLYFLTWRDVKVRYKQTALGVAWAVLQPAMMMVVFTVFFGRLAGVPTGGLPYPLFVYAGLLPWTFFANAVTNAGNSVVGSEKLITKVYFPRLAIPFASVGAAVVDFFVAFSLLIVLMVCYGIRPGWGLLLVPPLFLLMLLAAIGVGTLLAALNVAYRDFRYIMPFFIQLLMFATPTIYMQPDAATTNRSDSAAVAPAQADQSAGADTARNTPQRQRLGALLAINPMTAQIGSFRAAILGGRIPWVSLGVSAAAVGALFLGGCFYYRKVEDDFADVI